MTLIRLKAATRLHCMGQQDVVKQPAHFDVRTSK